MSQIDPIARPAQRTADKRRPPLQATPLPFLPRLIRALERRAGR
jgi:hypothetical protein